MGWFFGYRNTTEIKNEINAGLGDNLKLVDQKITNYGRHIWSVYETAQGERFINLDLCGKREGDWGYKSMNESMGPFTYDCPLDLIGKAGSTKDPHAQAWRDAVEAYHARRTRKLSAGMKVRLYGMDYTVETVGRKTTIRRHDGHLFRLTRSNMENLEVVG